MKSNINQKTILSALLSLLLLATACKKALDINQDPNNPIKIYVIQFDNTNPALTALLQSVATEPNAPKDTGLQH